MGVPAAAIVTTELIHETTLTLAAIGMPGLKPVAIDQPVSPRQADRLPSTTFVEPPARWRRFGKRRVARRPR